MYLQVPNVLISFLLGYTRVEVASACIQGDSIISDYNNIEYASIAKHYSSVKCDGHYQGSIYKSCFTLVGHCDRMVGIYKHFAFH